MKRMILGVAVMVTCLFAGQFARAGRVKLKDGTVLEGTVIKQSTGYWVKTPDGETHQIPNEDVSSVEASPKPGAANGGAGPAGAGRPAGTAGPITYIGTLANANGVQTPRAAVILWRQFIDSAPANSPDLAAARMELERWKALADSNAEKIKGRWIGGEEHRLLVDKARKLYKESEELLKGHQTLQAAKKLEEAATAYPNDFEMDFTLGYLYAMQAMGGQGDSADKALLWLDESLRVDPTCSEAVANKGLVLFAGKKQYEKGIALLRKSLDMQDRGEVVQNLVTALSLSPPVIQRSKEAKDAKEACSLLASKYRISGPGTQFFIVFPQPKIARGGQAGPAEPKPGSVWSGTGFVIRDDGLILTNRHVVEGGKAFTVTLEGGPSGGAVEKSVEVVAVDDTQDLALIRVKAAGKLATIRFAPSDSPVDGAECTVMGYPLLDRLGGSVKITRGIVSSSSQHTDGADVLVDAKVNPGNSGGPMLDKHGNVMAIVCMKTLSSRSEDAYGMGISAGKIREFLTKNHVAVAPGDTKGAALSTEDIAAEAKPATVCIMATN